MQRWFGLNKYICFQFYASSEEADPVLNEQVKSVFIQKLHFLFCINFLVPNQNSARILLQQNLIFGLAFLFVS